MPPHALRSVYRRLWPRRYRATAKLYRERFRFYLDLEVNFKQETGRGESMSEARRLKAAMVEPFPHRCHFGGERVFSGLTENDFDGIQDASPSSESKPCI